MIVKNGRYYYGGDADGNRGMWVNDTQYYSDISGDELDCDTAYIYDGKMMSLDEIVEILYEYDEEEDAYIDEDDASYCYYEVVNNVKEYLYKNKYDGDDYEDKEDH